MSLRKRPAVPVLAGLLGAVAYLAAATPPPDDDVKELARTRREIAQREFRRVEEGLAQPPVIAAAAPVPGIDDLVRWSRRWAESDLDLADSREARIAALQGHRERLEKWANTARELAKGAGSRLGESEIAGVDYALLEARTELAKLRQP